MKFILIALVILSANAMAANECADVVKCIEHVSKITDKKYIFDGTKIKGGLQSSSNTEITAENADTMLTYILDMNGYARVPTAVKDTYVVVESRDIRYQTIPVLESSMEMKPSIPQNYDYYTLNYKFKNFKQGQMREVANSLRPFMSRYGRIVELKQSGTIAIYEVAMKLPQAYELMKASDREWTKEEVAAMKEEERKREMREERHERKEIHIKKEEMKEEKKV